MFWNVALWRYCEAYLCARHFANDVKICKPCITFILLSDLREAQEAMIHKFEITLIVTDKGLDFRKNKNY